MTKTEEVLLRVLVQHGAKGIPSSVWGVNGDDEIFTYLWAGQSFTYLRPAYHDHNGNSVSDLTEYSLEIIKRLGHD
jgi:metal-dependent HD superfamily phosphatase/phosphodiesterase